MLMTREAFKNPEKKYRVNIMNHHWPENYSDMMDLLNDYGYGGAVINAPFDNGFTSSIENMEKLKQHIAAMKEHELAFWIYDEAGYPSGFANGLTLQKNPEVEAKGFYMKKVQAFAKKKACIEVDSESDRIVYVAKYPMGDFGYTETILDINRGEALPFEEKCVSCELEAGWVLYAFITKSAYEGAHTVHNVCSKSRYINIMSKEAVRTFIEVAYEPIAKHVPEAYQECTAVFTDEPSLMTAYCRNYEKFDYALAPWEDHLFETFEKRYGYQLQSFLPLIFEGNCHKSKAIRVDFYDLVGEMIGENFTKQLGDWCKEQGAIFSGHYLAEESLINHVGSYGNFVKVLSNAPYPGMDILECTPEIYNFNAAKYISMAARKSGTDGFMVELCPFFQIDLFNEAPYENMMGTVSLLYLGGVRKSNTYFMPKLKNEKEVFIDGYLEKEQANAFNEYVGRMGAVLDSAVSLNDIFVYYPIEDIQAKFEPEHSAICGERNQLNKAQKSMDRISEYIHTKGFDYNIIDREDVVNITAEHRLVNCEQQVKVIIVPEMDYIHNDTLTKLLELSKSGIRVFFEQALPKAGLKQEDIKEDISNFKTCSLETIVEELSIIPREVKISCKEEKAKFFVGSYKKEKETCYFVINGSREMKDFVVQCEDTSKAYVYDIETGEVYKLETDSVRINGYRGVFVCFEG